MSFKEELLEISTDLKRIGFKQSKPADGWRIFTIGDNHFDITKRFARFEVRIMSTRKILVSAMVATSTVASNRISKIDWAQSKKVSKDDFFSEASLLLKLLKMNMKSKSGERDGSKL